MFDREADTWTMSGARDRFWSLRYDGPSNGVTEPVESAFDREAKISGNEYLIAVLADRLQFS